MAISPIVVQFRVALPSIAVHSGSVVVNSPIVPPEDEWHYVLDLYDIILTLDGFDHRDVEPHRVFIEIVYRMRLSNVVSVSETAISVLKDIG